MTQKNRKCHKIFGGIIPEAFHQECSERGIACYDFMKEESIAVFNAIATAEGAILEALLHKQTNIHQSKTLVLGYGRCGKVLCGKLKGLSAHVTVCANNSLELALAEAFGLDVLPLKKVFRFAEPAFYAHGSIRENGKQFRPFFFQMFQLMKNFIKSTKGTAKCNSYLFPFQFHTIPYLSQCPQANLYFAYDIF